MLEKSAQSRVANSDVYPICSLEFGLGEVLKSPELLRALTNRELP